MKALFSYMKRYGSLVLLILLLTVCISLLIMNPVAPEEVEVIEGMPLSANIYSEINFRTLDRNRTDEAVKRALQGVPCSFRLDTAAQLDMLKKLQVLRSFFGLPVDAESDAATADPVFRSMLSQLPPLATNAFSRLKQNGQLALYLDAWEELINFGVLDPAGANLKPHDRVHVFAEAYTRHHALPHTDYIRVEGLLEKMTTDTCRYLSFAELSSAEAPREKIRALYASFLKPNLHFDRKKTESERQEATRDARVFKEISVGQLLIAKTEKLTASDVALYREYREAIAESPQHSRAEIGVLHRIALTLALLLFISMYIQHIHPEVTENNKSVWFLGGVALVCLLIFRLLTGGFFVIADFCSLPRGIVYIVLPLALPSLLIAVIYGYRSAIYVGLFVSGIAACSLNNSFATMLTGLLISAVAGYTVRHVVDYKRFFVRAMICTFITASFCAMVFASDYIFRSLPEEVALEEQALEQKQEKAESDGKWFGVQVFEPDSNRFAPVFRYRAQTLFYGLLLLPAGSAVLTSLLALLLLFMLESFCGVTSNMSYLSYTDRNHKLLKELQISAPGTYHHCERVALLAENAADAIGADRVRVQACALFHDVGKLKFPNMFTENNAPGENMHKGFAPVESVKFIRQHVTYGLELARKYTLPPLLERAIQSHHGTDFISFFYSIAEKECAKGAPPPNEKDYRYAGPLPSDREVVLIMLADCCEAAVQSIENLTAAKVQDMVNMLFEKKQKNGQLNASPLTLRELHLVQKAFVDTLLSMHNKRIAYPDQEKNIANASKNDCGKKKS